MTTTKLHRLNAGNYVTDCAESVGSWVVYDYQPDGRTTSDGWLVCRWVLTDYGQPDLESQQWVRTLADARQYIAEIESRSAAK